MLCVHFFQNNNDTKAAFRAVVAGLNRMDGYRRSSKRFTEIRCYRSAPYIELGLVRRSVWRYGT